MKFVSRLYKFVFNDASLKYWMGIGLAFALAGQSIMREIQPISISKILTELSTHWNETFHLSLNNPANIFVGLFFIVLATTIYMRLSLSLNIFGKGEESHISSGSWLFPKKFLPLLIANLSAYTFVMFQVASHQYSKLFFGVWLINILIFTFIFWKSEHQGAANSIYSVTSIDGIWMIALFAFAIAAGAYLLNDLPAGWIPDEGPFWKTARSIALGEISPPFFDFGVFTFPVGSSILQGWIMRWAGINMWGWRFASVLPAALTVIPLYLLAHELFDRRVAIAACVMMIVNPYFLAFARLGYNNSQSLFPVTLCIYFLVLGIRKNSRFHLWLAGLAAGLGFYTYFAAWLGLVILIVAIFLLTYIQGDKVQKSIVPLAIIIAGTLAVFLPRILYGMSGDTPVLLHFKIWETGPINTFYGQYVFGKERIAQSDIFMMSNQVELFYDPTLYGILLVRGIVRSAAMLFDPIGYADHQIIFGLTGPGSSIFFILGLGMTFANFKKTRYLIPSIWFLAGFIFLGILSSFPPRPTHMVAIIPVLAFISAIGLVSVLDFVASKNPEKLKATQFWKKTTTAIILSIIALTSLFQYFFLAPYAYLPPNADDYISWLGRQISAPANIFLVDHYSIERNPMDESLLKLTPHHVSFLAGSTLKSNPDQMKVWKNFAAFVEVKDGKEFADWIAQQIPGAAVQEAYVPGQRLRGYIVTDLQVNTSMDISLAHGLQDLWNSPARIILISCGLGILVLLSKGAISNKMSKTL